MTVQVGETRAQCGQVFFAQILARHAAVELECADSRHQYRSRGPDARRAALDVDELLGAQVGTKARLSHDVIRQAQTRHGRDHAVTAVGDVGEGAAVHKRRRALEGLHQVW